MNPVVFVFVSIANLTSAGQASSAQFTFEPLQVRSELNGATFVAPAARIHASSSPRSSEEQSCYRRPLEQGRGIVLVCDVKASR